MPRLLYHQPAPIPYRRKAKLQRVAAHGPDSRIFKTDARDRRKTAGRGMGRQPLSARRNKKNAFTRRLGQKCRDEAPAGTTHQGPLPRLAETRAPRLNNVRRPVLPAAILPSSGAHVPGLAIAPCPFPAPSGKNTGTERGAKGAGLNKTRGNAVWRELTGSGCIVHGSVQADSGPQ